MWPRAIDRHRYAPLNHTTAPIVVPNEPLLNLRINCDADCGPRRLWQLEHAC